MWQNKPFGLAYRLYGEHTISFTVVSSRGWHGTLIVALTRIRCMLIRREFETQGSSYFLEQETLLSLLSTGWLQELSRAWFTWALMFGISFSGVILHWYLKLIFLEWSFINVQNRFSWSYTSLMFRTCFPWVILH